MPLNLSNPEIQYWIKEAENRIPPPQIDELIISLTDFTNLSDTCDTEAVEKLCHGAHTPLGNVAAICIYPQFVRLAKRLLKDIPVATVANFPQGRENLETVLHTIDTALQDGADEIDAVMPYHYYFSNEKKKIIQFLSECRKITSHKILKIILETGALPPALITEASRDSIHAGVNFIKTSTGKIHIHATPEAAILMLLAIQQSSLEGYKTGIKISGGIRDLSIATTYFQLASLIMGDVWITRETFRIGSSKLV